MLKKLMKVAAGPALLLTPVAVTAADRPAGVMYKNPGCECCDGHAEALRRAGRSEEHTSELQSLMRISYAVFCLKKKKDDNREAKVKQRQRRQDNRNHERRTIMSLVEH